MDITGGAGGYRAVAIRCPGCAESMTVQALAEAEVDICHACGGLWLDWFDGELRAVTNEALQAGASTAGPLPGARNEALAVGACPRCTRQLVPERYVLNVELPTGEGEARKVLTQRTGAELLRCEDCAGVFVTRASAEVLATLPPEEAPPSESPAALEPLPWQKLVLLLKRLLGLAG
jgi:Zn-finger nucleic acid-binding protein